MENRSWASEEGRSLAPWTEWNFSRQLGFRENLISWWCICDEALLPLTTSRTNTVTIFNYAPLSEARKVALYILAFTFGDSLSKTAMVVICPFTESIFSQFAGSDNLVYLQNENAVSLFLLTWNLKQEADFSGLVPDTNSMLTCISVGDGWDKQLYCEYFCGSGLGGNMVCVLRGQVWSKRYIGGRGERWGTQFLYCGLGLGQIWQVSL